MNHFRGSHETIARLQTEMDGLSERVSNGMGIQEAGREINLDRNQACKVWKRIREHPVEQAR